MRRERGAMVVALPSVMTAVMSLLAEAGTLYDAARASSGVQAFAGRGAAYRMRRADGDWLVRHYRRGGLVAQVLADEYVRAGVPRPLRELEASVAARARGVATPEVLAAVVYPAGLVYRGDLATRYIENSRDLAGTVLGAARADSAGRMAAWRAAGALLRTAFAAGVAHADLNLRNILIAGPAAAPQALLLDLDRAVVRRGAVSDGVRSAMLERLERSRRKIERQSRTLATREELVAFAAALGGAHG